MTLLELTLWLGLGFVAFQFWRIRSISEFTDSYLRQYCKNNQLQLLSIARAKTRITFNYSKPDWHNIFVFEFSGNGEDRYSGEVELVGKHIIRTTLPPHRGN